MPQVKGVAGTKPIAKQVQSAAKFPLARFLADARFSREARYVIAGVRSSRAARYGIAGAKSSSWDRGKLRTSKTRSSS